MSSLTAAEPTTPARRRPRLDTLAWGLLVALSAVPLFGAVMDLVADSGGALPADHVAAFRAATGATAAQTDPGTLRYLHTLELGYAAHELLFAALLLVVILGPLRRRRLWAWLACWTLVAANLGYAAIFGAYDSTLLLRSLLAGATTAAALAALAPSVIRRTRG